MIKSEFMSLIAGKLTHLSEKQVAELINTILDTMSESLIAGKRIEIRGFGSFAIHHHAPKTARNPKTGEKVFTKGKRTARFKPGKDLKACVNQQSEF